MADQHDDAGQRIAHALRSTSAQLKAQAAVLKVLNGLRAPLTAPQLRKLQQSMAATLREHFAGDTAFEPPQQGLHVVQGGGGRKSNVVDDVAKLRRLAGRAKELGLDHPAGHPDDLMAQVLALANEARLAGVPDLAVVKALHVARGMFVHEHYVQLQPAAKE